VEYPLTAARRGAVLDLLETVSGERPTIASEEPLGHQWAPVTRLTFQRELPGVGLTVVIKTRRVDGDGYGGPAYFRREQSGLATAGESRVTPRLITADDVVGVAITGDLGNWPTLEDILRGADADAATAAMIGLGRAVGRLHASTLDRATCHGAALNALGSAVTREDRLGRWPGVDRWRDVESASVEFGFPDAHVAAGDIAFIIERLLEPSPFAALIHLDLNPTNVLVTADGVRLVDFEQSTFGHIGIDAAALHYPFPNYSPHWAVLPEEVTGEADRVHRLELAAVLPSDVLAGYDEMLAIGAAAALSIRVQRLAKLTEPGQTAHDRWRRRAQLVQQIRVFEQLASRANCLPALTGWFTRLADAMTERWVDAASPPPPLFPAFQAR
jgi:hypothetical protein